MILVTDEIRLSLLANGETRDADPVPVLKLFIPLCLGCGIVCHALAHRPVPSFVRAGTGARLCKGPVR